MAAISFVGAGASFHFQTLNRQSPLHKSSKKKCVLNDSFFGESLACKKTFKQHSSLPLSSKSLSFTPQASLLDKLITFSPTGEVNPIQENGKDLQGQKFGLLLGNRIPKDFFVAKGCGTTNEGGGTDPWETGSYDLALEDAGIMNFNIVPYTSVIPPEALEISYEEAKKNFRHGAVLESIMAQMNGVEGDRISAGVGRAQVRRISDGAILGGYAAEYKGHAKAADAERILTEDIQGIFDRRYKPGEHELFDVKFVVQEVEVEKGFGTVLAAICFVNYIFPVLSLENS